MQPTPKKLYKYRPFHTNSVIEMERNVVYYANPKSFNDPADCSPVVDVDITLKDLERLCKRMLIEEKGSKVDSATAEKTAVKELERIRYYASEPNDDGSPLNMEQSYGWRLRRRIEECLNSSMAMHGVLSLAKKWDCPLMWSHYADQHRGICIEYDSSDLRFASPKPVDYSGNRNLKASDLYGFYVEQLSAARDRVMEGYFYRKAPQWRYEKEWRHVRKGCGIAQSPYKISAIYFGVRCDESVESMIVKLFQGAEHDPKFYRVIEDTKTFKLRRYCPDIEDFLYGSPTISELWRHEELANFFEDETQGS